LWGVYNGLFLTLERLFLREALQRCGKLVATSVTLFIVTIGWAIFRSENTAHIAPFLAALFGKSQALGVLEVPPEVPLALVLGAVISLFPATRLYPWLVRLHEQHVWLRVLTIAALLVIYLLALARAFAVPFQPFIYFRF
jgi:alginate O-acetyltransferase complex protein AlgI